MELFAGPELKKRLPDFAKEMQPATAFNTEYSDLQCTVEVVPSEEKAIQHISNYGSCHTDSIITENGKHRHASWSSVFERLE